MLLLQGSLAWAQVLVPALAPPLVPVLVLVLVLVLVPVLVPVLVLVSVLVVKVLGLVFARTWVVLVWHPTAAKQARLLAPRYHRSALSRRHHP